MQGQRSCDVASLSQYEIEFRSKPTWTEGKATYKSTLHNSEFLWQGTRIRGIEGSEEFVHQIDLRYWTESPPPRRAVPPSPRGWLCFCCHSAESASFFYPCLILPSCFRALVCCVGFVQVWNDVFFYPNSASLLGFQHRGLRKSPMWTCKKKPLNHTCPYIKSLVDTPGKKIHVLSCSNFSVWFCFWHCPSEVAA